MQIAYDTTTVSARTRADKSIISKQIITIEALKNYVQSSRAFTSASDLDETAKTFFPENVHTIIGSRKGSTKLD